MKLKYYLRGLGVGIVITAIILTITSSPKTEKLSDEEIIRRAEQLGMVMEEDTGLLNGSEEEGSNEPENSGQDTEPEDTPTAGEDAGQQSAQEPVAEPPVQEPVYHNITIAPGEYSDTISQKLLEAGLITNQEEFNHYLVDNGMDELIAVGDHLIPVGASYEEIAVILCEKQENP